MLRVALTLVLFLLPRFRGGVLALMVGFDVLLDIILQKQGNIKIAELAIL